MMRQLLILSIMLTGVSGCAEDRCKQAEPSLQVDLRLAGGATVDGVSELWAEVEALGVAREQKLDLGPLQQRGEASLRVVAATATKAFEVRVKVEGRGNGGTVRLRGEQRFSASADACNFFVLTLEDTAKPDGPMADAGPPDLSADILQLDSNPPDNGTVDGFTPCNHNTCSTCCTPEGTCAAQIDDTHCAANPGAICFDCLSLSKKCDPVSHICVTP